MAAADLGLLASITRRAPFHAFRLRVGGQLGDFVSVHGEVSQSLDDGQTRERGRSGRRGEVCRLAIDLYFNFLQGRPK